MFRKLLKYEWKANAGLLGMLSLAAVGVGVLGTIILRVLVNYSDEISSSRVPAVLIFIPLGLLLAFCFLALMVYIRLELICYGIEVDRLLCCRQLVYDTIDKTMLFSVERSLGEVLLHLGNLICLEHQGSEDRLLKLHGLWRCRSCQLRYQRLDGGTIS